MDHKDYIIIRMIAKQNGKAGLTKVSKLLRGTLKEPVEKKHLTEYGALWAHNHRGIEIFIEQLIDNGNISVETQGVCRYLTVTEKGWHHILLPMPSIMMEEEVKISLPIYQALMEWRQEKAKEKNQPPFFVFSNRTLRSLSVLRPVTKIQLEGISGFSDNKLEQYGEEILKIIKESEV